MSDANFAKRFSLFPANHTNHFITRCQKCCWCCCCCCDKSTFATFTALAFVKMHVAIPLTPAHVSNRRRELRRSLWLLSVMWEGNGLHFGRTFCNCLRGLALTFLREWDAAQGWQMVGKRFADKPKLNLITNKPDVLLWCLCRRLEITLDKRGYHD